MVEEVFGVALELAVRAEGEAGAESFSGALVQVFHGRPVVDGTAAELVRGELSAPAEGVPEAGIIRTEGDGALDCGDAVGVASAAGDEDGCEVLERFDVVGVDLERAMREGHTARDVARGVALLCLGKERAGVVSRAAQCMPSSRERSSASVKTRNELVRTFPWLLTASETRVIVSSSGASAMTT